MPYDTFISYSHTAEARLAPAFHRTLERLGKPWHRRRILRVFRDDTTLSNTPNLWDAIVTALDDSTWFVLMASPESATSAWVNREIDHWLRVKKAPPESVLVVLTGGSLAWNSKTGSFDDGPSTSLPAALRGVFDDEPRYTDLSWVRDELPIEDFDERHSRFRDAVADVAATIHDRPKDELESEDIRQHRRSDRLRRLAIAGLVALAAVALALSKLAVGFASDADDERAAAERALHDLEMANGSLDDLNLAINAKEVELSVLSLVRRALGLASTEPAVAAIVAAEASILSTGQAIADNDASDWAFGSHWAVADALLESTYGYPRLVRVLPLSSDDGLTPWLRFEDRDRSISGDELVTIADGRESVWSVPDGILLSSSASDTPGPGLRPSCPEPTENAFGGQTPLRLSTGTAINLDSSGRRLEWSHEFSGELVRSGSFQLDEGCVGFVAADGAGRYLAVSTKLPYLHRPNVGIWEFSTTEASGTRYLPVPSSPGTGYPMLSRNGAVVAFHLDHGHIFSRHLSNGDEATVTVPGTLIGLSHDGALLLMSDSSRRSCGASKCLLLADRSSGELLATIPAEAGELVGADVTGVLDGGSRRVAVAVTPTLSEWSDQEVEVAVWTIESSGTGSRASLAFAPAAVSAAEGVEISPDGVIVAVPSTGTTLGGLMVDFVEVGSDGLRRIEGPDTDRVVFWGRFSDAGARYVAGTWDRTQSFVDVIAFSEEAVGVGLEARIAASFPSREGDRGAVTPDGRFGLVSQQTLSSHPNCTRDEKLICGAVHIVDLASGRTIGSRASFGPVALTDVAVRDDDGVAVLVVAGPGGVHEWRLTMDEWREAACNLASPTVLERVDAVLGHPSTVCTDR